MGAPRRKVAAPLVTVVQGVRGPLSNLQRDKLLTEHSGSRVIVIVTLTGSVRVLKNNLGEPAVRLAWE